MPAKIVMGQKLHKVAEVVHEAGLSYQAVMEYGREGRLDIWNLTTGCYVEEEEWQRFVREITNSSIGNSID